jgi:hypothetical protein
MPATETQHVDGLGAVRAVAHVQDLITTPSEGSSYANIQEDVSQKILRLPYPQDQTPQSSPAQAHLVIVIVIEHTANKTLRAGKASGECGWAVPSPAILEIAVLSTPLSPSIPLPDGEAPVCLGVSPQGGFLAQGAMIDAPSDTANPLPPASWFYHSWKKMTAA